MKVCATKAVELVRRLLEDDGEAEPVYNWEREWFNGDRRAVIDYLSVLTTIYLDGKPYFNDSNEAILFPRREGDPAYRFDTYDAYRDFLRAHNADTEGMDVDVERHVYNIKLPTVPKISLEDKLKHEVYRTRDGQWIFLKMPTDENFIQREGVDMRHCLSVAYKDYCARMRTAEIDLYSMIDATKGKPVVDIEIALTKSSYGGPVGQPTVTQLRGEANECPPQDKYLPALAEFFSAFGKNWKLTGVRSFDGRFDGEEFLKRWHALGNPRLGESTAKDFILDNPSPFEIRPISEDIWEVYEGSKLLGRIYQERPENIPAHAHANWHNFLYTAISRWHSEQKIEFFKTKEEAYQFLTGQV